VVRANRVSPLAGELAMARMMPILWTRQSLGLSMPAGRGVSTRL